MPMTRVITFLLIAVVLIAIAGIILVATAGRRTPVNETITHSASNSDGQRVSFTRDINGQTVVLTPLQGQQLTVIQVQQPPTAVPEPIVEPTLPVTVEEILPTAVPDAPVTVEEILPTAVPAQPDAGLGGIQPQGGGPGINPGVEPITFVAHTVQAGNTLFSLARNNNTTIELMAARGISSATLIPGQVIQIPIPNAAYCLNSRPRVVHSGDTAFSLARNSGISLEQFRIMNNLDANYSLSMGQVICLP